MPIYEYGKKEGGEKCWEDAKPVTRELGELLKANGGPFIGGDTRTSYIEAQNFNWENETDTKKRE